MGRFIHLVVSDPPVGTPDDEFNEWYEAHVQEILAVEGWESATRYLLDAIVNSDQTGGFRYLSVYELSLPPSVALANLEAAGMGNADSYVDKKNADVGQLPMPSWFPEIRFGSWNANQIGDVILPKGARSGA
jgi:hypothetical protein